MTSVGSLSMHISSMDLEETLSGMDSESLTSEGCLSDWMSEVYYELTYVEGLEESISEMF